ncbi:ubiquinone biosynthesis O-methyltransferase, mitochondrial [Leucoraja erinacea]|uniref:ubiquinone biosynthesis O-methyltransferase, mitochondrial n=1 Tax=Leucoraja erinaceus TaxID=7782 RepID=UPI00245434A5|nr:ubiquinone biosynthesis O-methyltransferase, mitochondrial [Leucoraja erinacea]
MATHRALLQLRSAGRGSCSRLPLRFPERALRATFWGWAAATGPRASRERQVPGGNVCSYARGPPGYAAASRRYTTSKSTVDPDEMKTFQALSQKWWDSNGEFAALHALNDLRVPFIRDTLLTFSEKMHLGHPLQGFRILDVGCGGGLLSEPLGRLGAVVVGIDPLEDNIRTAKLHQLFDPVLKGQVEYTACSLEEMAMEATNTFDAVVASEVVEHVNNLEIFIKCAAQVLKPEGSLFITTINKTILSYAMAIVAAEYVLRIVPSGTHEWEKFISPEELEKYLTSSGLTVEAINGMLFNPIFGTWSWINDCSVNYALHAVKSKVAEQSDFVSESSNGKDNDSDQSESSSCSKDKLSKE